MQIWVDGDACPRPVKETLFRAANRTGVPLTLVANRPLSHPSSPHIRMLLVPPGFDMADDRIVAEVSEGDIVVTADIPLAAATVSRGAQVINPRGQPYDAENIQQRLAMRNLMEELRNTGLETGGPPPFSKRDLQQFANQLDRLLARR